MTHVQPNHRVLKSYLVKETHGQTPYRTSQNLQFHLFFFTQVINHVTSGMCPSPSSWSGWPE